MNVRKAVLSLVLVAGAGCASPRSPAGIPVVRRIEAGKFAFTPERVQVKRGTRVSLELVSRDVVHGFSVPELGVRADAIPGHVTRVELDATRAGSFPFHCDVYCGDGHDDMAGVIDVLR